MLLGRERRCEGGASDARASVGRHLHLPTVDPRMSLALLETLWTLWIPRNATVMRNPNSIFSVSHPSIRLRFALLFMDKSQLVITKAKISEASHSNPRRLKSSGRASRSNDVHVLNLCTYIMRYHTPVGLALAHCITRPRTYCVTTHSCPPWSTSSLLYSPTRCAAVHFLYRSSRV